MLNAKIAGAATVLVIHIGQREAALRQVTHDLTLDGGRVMADAHVELSFEAIGELLRTPEMEAEMVRRGEGVMAWAILTAPVAKEGTHRGRYKASFHLEHGREGLPGATVLGDRAWCEVINDAPEAMFVEKGTKRQPAQHILLNAMIAGGRD